MRSRFITVALLGAALVAEVTVGPPPPAGAADRPARAAASVSQFNPPPLCSAPHAAGCYSQPSVSWAGSFTKPVRTDTPTLVRDFRASGGVQYSGRVTFTVIDRGLAKNGDASRILGFKYPQFYAMPIDGYSDPASTGFVMVPDPTDGSRCQGRTSCTYVTTATNLDPGWYRATDTNGLLLGARACPSSSPNGVAGCYDTYSEAAFYVPKVTDVAPPSVEMASVGRGLTTKAIAVGRDPYGKPLGLTWDFGDGTQAPGTFGKVVSHTYAYPGDYVVTARVRTSDGRYSSDSGEAGIVPPRPVLQAVGRVGGGTTGAAAAQLQGWPPGSRAILWAFTGGCPPTTMKNAQEAGGIFTSGYTAVKEDGTVGLALTYLPADADAFVLETSAFVDLNDTGVEVHRFSTCVTTYAALHQTSDATAPGATEIPVTSSSVPVGHVVALDVRSSEGGQPDLSEWRTVTGHGSLVVSALDRAHASGSYLLDAGLPLSPYVVDPPPANPAAPTPDLGAPSPPTKVVAKPKDGHKVKVSFSPGANGGSPVTGYLVSCTPTGKGKPASATTTRTSVKLKGLSRNKKYRCSVRATNAFGAGGVSAPSAVFRST
jgi:hypothetical protein